MSGPDQQRSPLGRMIGAMSEAAFFDVHYERAPLVCCIEESDRFSDLLSLADVDRFIATADLRPDMVALVRGGAMLEPARFVGASGRVIPSAVAQEYLNGATIILQQLQESLGELGSFCRSLEKIFSAHVQANVYVTPPRAQGFAPHADVHDVFILQIAGQKDWHLQPNGDEDAERRLTLSAGDCAYIPRGVVHAACNGASEPSLHVTIGIIPRRWTDLLAAAVWEAAACDPRLARALPPGYASGRVTPGEIVSVAAELSRGLSQPEVLEAALERLIGDFLHERRPQAAGLLASGSDPKAGYRRRPDVQFRLRALQSELVLSGPGGDLGFAPFDAAALEIALSGQAFEPVTLPSADPHRLVQRLWAHGYLERIDEA